MSETQAKYTTVTYAKADPLSAYLEPPKEEPCGCIMNADGFRYVKLCPADLQEVLRSESKAEIGDPEHARQFIESAERLIRFYDGAQKEIGSFPVEVVRKLKLMAEGYLELV